MWDLGNPSDLIEAMRDGGLTDEAIVKTLTLAVEELQEEK